MGGEQHAPSPAGPSELSRMYATARTVYHATLFIAMAAALTQITTLRGLVRCPRASPRAGKTSRSSFAAGPKTTYWRLVLAMSFSDLLASTAVFSYLASETTHNCLAASVLGSTGELLSGGFTAALAVEAWFLLARGARTGGGRRLAVYCSVVAVAVGAIQTYAALKPHFETHTDSHTIWCHLRLHRNTGGAPSRVGDLVVFYIPALLCFLTCLIFSVCVWAKLWAVSRHPATMVSDRRIMRRAAWRLFLLPLVFLVAWLPTFAHYILVQKQSELVKGPTTGHFAFDYVNFILLVLLPVWNLALLIFLNRDVRGQIRRTLCCGCRTYQRRQDAIVTEMSSFAALDGRGGESVTFEPVDWEDDGGDYGRDDNDDDLPLPSASMYSSVSIAWDHEVPGHAGASGEQKTRTLDEQLLMHAEAGAGASGASEPRGGRLDPPPGGSRKPVLDTIEMAAMPCGGR